MPLGAHKAAMMGTAGVSTADVVLINTITATSDSAISFTSGITSTYGEYIFRFYNMNPETDGAEFQFQVNATDGADYNDSAITSTFFRAYHFESGSPALGYDSSSDLAQGTGFQTLNLDVTNDADGSVAGELHLFNPASTTYVKHFYAQTVHMYNDPSGTFNNFIGGYINDTTAVDDIRFKFSAGDFDGKIKMWGVK